MLEALRQGTTIVEGLHDVKALAHFGIKAIPYSRLSAALPSISGRVYLLADDDRGGEEKKEKMRMLLLEHNSGYLIDETLGRRMLKMLNVTSVEQICGPIEEARESGDYYGKNISRYSKVHGAG
jgi:5S rRNA maturation endonuclease (ribonuclease M5)